MTTLRLSPELEQAVDDAAKKLGLSKSELIRKSIVDFLEKIEKPVSWDVGRDLFGKYSSGLGNLSSDRKKFLKEKLKGRRV